MTETTCAQWRAGCFNLVIGMGEASGHHDGHLAGQPITDHYKDSHLSCESKMTRDRSIHKYCNIRTLNQTLESGHCIKQCLLLGNIIWLEQDLVGWCFQPSQPQRITSGLNTNFTLSPSHSFHKSCFLSPFIFCQYSTWEPASSRVTYFIPRAYTGTMC